MKLAVTAASGGLGSAIIKELLKQLPPDQVIGLARSPQKAQKLGVEIRPGDYSNNTELIKSLNGIDAVLLISGMDAPQKRIIHHRNVIEAAKEAGVQKLVYTSIFGKVGDTSFSPIIASNRQTEKDIQTSGLNWVIGRNGLYIEPDVEYLKNYIAAGKITNCAADGLCSYTTRDELAFAYSKMLLEDKHNGKVYNLCGEAISQNQLTRYLNRTFACNLTYEPMSIEEYQKQREAELGEYLGPIIAGIYACIRNGSAHMASDFKIATGREHLSWDEYFSKLGK